MERTLLMVKPDAFAARREILDFVRMNGFEVAERHEFTFSPELASVFYGEHEGAGFFPSLIDFTTSGPVCAAVLVGDDAVAKLRHLLGATDPAIARGGTIRQKWGTGMPNNAAHASATPEAAEREIQLLFGVAAAEDAPREVVTESLPDLGRALAEADDALEPRDPYAKDRSRERFRK